MTPWKSRRRTGSVNRYLGLTLPSIVNREVLRVTFLLVSFSPALELSGQIPGVLLDGLSDPVFQQRQRAQDKLLKWSSDNADQAVPLLIRKAGSEEDPESRERIMGVLRSLSDIDYLSGGSAYLGIVMREEVLPGAPEEKIRVGIRVGNVMSGSPAELAGLREGDLVIALSGKGWSEAGATNLFAEEIAAMLPLSEIKLSIVREDKKLEIPVKLGRRPVRDLRIVRGDLAELDERAKELHFRKWMAARRKASRVVLISSQSDGLNFFRAKFPPFSRIKVWI